MTEPIDAPRPEKSRQEEAPLDLDKWRAVGTWVAAEVGSCTCGTGRYGHEQGCGLEPLSGAATESAALAIAEDHNVLVGEVRRLGEALQQARNVQPEFKDERLADMTEAEVLELLDRTAERVETILCPVPGCSGDQCVLCEGAMRLPADAETSDAISQLWRSGERRISDAYERAAERADAAEAELAELRAKTADENLIRRAISDPGQFLPRGDDYEERIVSWSARAVVAALAPTSSGGHTP